MTLTSFAKMVLEIAPGTFKTLGRKAWIHRVYTQYYVLTGYTVAYDTFRAMLWESHQAKLLTLSRCDMVEAFSATDVRRSTMNVMNGAAQFNFINF